MSEELFQGSGEMAGLMRSLDWSQTPLGSPKQWSQSLKTSIRIMLGSRYPMFVWWGETLTKFYNDDYIPILGKRHPWALSQPASGVWAEIWDTLGPQAEAVLREGQASWNEAVLLTMERNGYTEETYFTFSYSPVPNDDGGIGGVFCACTEETRRVLSDRRLQTLRELAAQIIVAKTVKDACEISVQTLANNPYDVSFALLYLLDETGTKARLVATTGLAAGMPASPIEISMQPGIDDRWELASVLATGKSRAIEQVESKFGALPGGVWSESSRMAAVLPLATAGQSQPIGFLIAGISPRREFDDDYKGFFDLIAGQITTAIANAQAYEAERQRAEALAELDRAKTAFFSNVSHEFRTPLTLMLSPLEDTLANLDGTIPAKEREQLQLVQRNGMRLLKLVNSLLDFSRIEAGRVQAAYEPIDLATYTAELASTFRSLIERAGMSLMVDCPPLPAAVYVDRQMWEKIVLNLLSNAFKFTLAGTITVRLQWLDSHVELSVADTGVGIRADELPHLFERFHRVENSQGRSFEGTGIGLSLVQELVKLQGGAIAVSSSFGQGSCFTVTIPTGTAHLPKERINISRTSASTALGAIAYVEEAQRWLSDEESKGVEEWRSEAAIASPLHPLTPIPARILLADDNADMRDYIRRLLSGVYTVETVADGAAALSAIQNHPPDLVLTDVMMPGIDGFELLQLLRSHPQTKAIPMILLSARAGEEARLEGLAVGADDYLIKPFSARELLARVEATLKLSKLRREALQQEQALRAASETAQQKAEAAFRRIERLLESMSEAFIALDLDWRIIYQNATAERINNKPRSQVLGKTLWEEWPAAVGSISEQQYRHAVTQQVAVHFEQHYYEPPDHDVWLEVHAYPFEEGLGIFYRDISDRKRAEAALRLSEQRFRLMADAVPQIVWLTDAQGRVEFFNKQWSDYTGVPYEPTTAAEVAANFVHPDDSARTIEAFNEARRVGGIFSVEHRIRSAAGAYRWFLVRAEPYRDPQTSEIVRWFGASVDIHDRKQAESALREREQRLSIATDAAQLGIFEWKVPEDITTWENDRLYEMYGLTPADGAISAQEFFENYLHPDDAEAFTAKLSEAMQTGILRQASYRIHRQDGTIRWIEVNGQFEFAADGSPLRFVGVNADITDRKQAEATIVQREAQFRQLADAMPQQVWITDAQGNTQYVNQQWTVYTGLTIEQTQNIDCVVQVIHPDDFEATNELWNTALTTGTPYQAELRLKQLADDTYRWFLSRAIGIRDEQGQIVQWFGTSTDIEEIRRAQAAREQLLQREQTAREVAENANRIKDEFLAVLSHELRSPLNPILGWSKLLQQGKLDAAKATTALATIERNAQLQVQLIDDLLDISRILRGKLNLTVMPVDLDTVIWAALETVRLAAEAKSIQIQTTSSPGVGMVMGDAGRLQQVVWNLLSNAVKFTPVNGQVAVALSSTDSHAQIQVSDTGKGIKPNFLPYVFEHFRQEDGATTRKFGGLGLGLAIARQIVELHGGTVAVDSAGEGMGATFTVQIPLASCGSVLPAIKQSSGSTGDLSGIRILVVDDEADSREFVAFVLEQAGAIVTSVASGMDALQAFSQAVPDLIISDIGMPEIDGYMLLRHIRRLPLEQGGQIPAIALTAYAGEIDRASAIAAGFQRHLAKPIDPETVAASAIELVSSA